MEHSVSVPVLDPLGDFSDILLPFQKSQGHPLDDPSFGCIWCRPTF